jgi:hypothetical protein
MLELLNMKGKHKHKWDYLREVRDIPRKPFVALHSAQPSHPLLPHSHGFWVFSGWSPAPHPLLLRNAGTPRVQVLAERVVYDDMLHRIWYADDSAAQGVLFACKQGQVNLDRPLGESVRRVGAEPAAWGAAGAGQLGRPGQPRVRRGNACPAELDVGSGRSQGRRFGVTVLGCGPGARARRSGTARARRAAGGDHRPHGP